MHSYLVDDGSEDKNAKSQVCHKKKTQIQRF